MGNKEENVLKVTNFNDVEKIANKLKEENSIIIEISEINSKDRIRIIDFAAGLVYYNGKIEKLEKDKFRIILDENQK
jgi:FtsZ-interacting cell division protein YlmF